MIFRKIRFWRGETNELYRFRVCKRAEDLPERSGIYVFVRRRFFVFTKALYVGKATNLFDRVNGHERWEEARKKGAREIHIRHAHASKLDRIEEDLIRHLKPKLNNIHKPRSDCDAPNHEQLRGRWMCASEYWSLNDPKPKRKKAKSSAKSYWDKAA